MCSCPPSGGRGVWWTELGGRGLLKGAGGPDGEGDQFNVKRFLVVYSEDITRTSLAERAATRSVMVSLVVAQNSRRQQVQESASSVRHRVVGRLFMRLLEQQIETSNMELGVVLSWMNITSSLECQ